MTPERTGPLRIDVLTIFPDLVTTVAATSVIGRGQRAGALDLRVHDLREKATDAHRSVDDAPFGGGAGMVLAPEPIFRVVEEAEVPRPLFLVSPAGRRFDQDAAHELAAMPVGFSLLCGRYEGVDERVVDHLADGEWSIGDYVIAGGELAALVIVEAVGRLVPGVVGNATSVRDESFSDGLIEYPQYTRPASFRGWDVPEVLLSGDHAKIAAWRRAASLARTIERRPDLIAARGGLTEAEEQLLAAHGYRVAAQSSGDGASPPPAVGD